MDRTRFLRACGEALEAERGRGGIGTLGEKAQHAALKRYFDPDPSHHEIRVGPYVADIRNEGGFVEIQTRQFFRLRKKLEYFLDLAPVTVVYPVPALKWVIWLDGEGNPSPRRKSPKRPTACAILPELYQIKPLLGREGLSFRVLLLEAEDYRLRTAEGKRGSTRFERLPVALLDEIPLESPEDFRRLVPEPLPEEFTAREFAREAKLTAKEASVSMNVLAAAGAVELRGKRGRAYLYRRA